MANVQGNLNNYRNLRKAKIKLDKRQEILFGGAGKNIFPDMDKLQQMSPLNSKKKVKGVKFAECPSPLDNSVERDDEPDLSEQEEQD